MIFQVNLSDAKPVYQQLMDQVKLAIASGRLKPGDRLPTVRDVAVQVRVNRNTVARVYAELEREGLLYTRVGQGSFVSDRGSTLNRTVQKKQVQAAMDEIIAQARLFGISREQLDNLWRERAERIYPEAGDAGKPQDPRR